jgi:hypothetical protein
MTRRGALVPGLFDQIKAGLSMLCPSPGEGTGKRLRDASSELAALGIVIKKSLSFAALCIVEGGRKGGRSSLNDRWRCVNFFFYMHVHLHARCIVVRWYYI